LGALTGACAFLFHQRNVGAIFYPHCKLRWFAIGFVPSKFCEHGTFLTY
jgi:hypothetical protein